MGSREDVLQGWKSIASYVDRDVRTVRRWEKQRALPVRRMPGDGRANVYALKLELDRWLDAGNAAGAAAESTVKMQTAELEATVSAAAQSVPRGDDAGRGRARLLTGGMLAAGVLAVLGMVWQHGGLHVAAGSTRHTAVAVSGAEELRLRGVYFLGQRTPASLQQALRCFAEAIERDPQSAASYAGLSDTYSLLREYAMMPSSEAFPKAYAAAEHAIALDPGLSEAHASVAFTSFFWFWRAAEAEREFRTAIALDPGDATAHHWYGSMLTHQGRFREALAELDEAQRLEPNSAAIVSSRAYALGLSGRVEEARALLRDVAESSSAPSAHQRLAVLALLEPRDPELYLKERAIAATLRGDRAEAEEIGSATRAWQAAGETAMWRALFGAEQRRRGEASSAKAEEEAALGDMGATMNDLETLLQRHDTAMLGITIDPLFHPLHHDARYLAMVDAVGLPRPE